MSCRIGAAGPLHPVFPPKRKKHSPSRERRRARRAEARQKQAEEALDKATENEAVKAGPALSENYEVGNHEEEQDVSIVNDELCPDDVYHQAGVKVLATGPLDAMSVECCSCPHLM